MKKRSIFKLAVTAFLAFALVLCMSACSEQEAVSSEPEADTSVFPEGTTLGESDISGKTADEALELAREELNDAMSELEITVKFTDDTIPLSGSDFTVTEVLDLYIQNLLEKYEAGDYTLPYVIDLSESGRQKLTTAAADCSTPAEEATVSGYNNETQSFEFTEGKNGSKVDMVNTLKSIRQLLSEKHGGNVQAAFTEVKPKQSKEYLAENFKQLSTYTSTSTNTANGNSNMRLALSHINGTILKPGETFSYNTAIGNSTDPGAGWLPAGGILNGIMVQMYGGGICQGSTTLYNAALLAGMEVVERRCHSIPSSYCPIGLDATVDYGNIDFKFSNPLEDPVYIMAWMDGVKLYVSFYGIFPEEWDKVVVSSEQTGSTAPLGNVRFAEDTSLATGQYVRRSSGNTGYTARAYRTYYKGDEPVKSEELPSSNYPATGKVYAVGPDTDTDKVDTSKESGTTIEESPSPSPSITPTPSPEPGPDDTTPPSPPPGPVDTPTPTPEVPVDTPTPAPPTIPPEGGGETSGIIDWS